MLATDTALNIHEMGTEDGRLGLFLPVRSPTADLVGIAMILGDAKSLGDDAFERMSAAPVRSIMLRLAVLLKPNSPPGAPADATPLASARSSESAPSPEMPDAPDVEQALAAVDGMTDLVARYAHTPPLPQTHVPSFVEVAAAKQRAETARSDRDRAARKLEDAQERLAQARADATREATAIREGADAAAAQARSDATREASAIREAAEKAAEEASHQQNGREDGD